MIRTIKNEKEFQALASEIRNRQLIFNPNIIDVSDLISHHQPFDWDKEYLKMERINDIDIVKLLFY